MRALLRVLVALAVILLVAAAALRIFLGGGERLEDRTTSPLIPSSGLEVVANIDLPPGNIAVSRTGRIFFTFHPEASPPVQVAELVGGKPRPYPNAEFQESEEGTPHFQSILSIRIDRQNRLWVLDYARYGTGQPRLLAFDLETDEIVHRYDFPDETAGFLSMLNDFQVDPDGRWIYITDTSIYRFEPAIIVYDTVEKSSRRMLEGHESVQPKPYIINAAGRDMVFAGLVTLRIGVDSIALDKRGEWLYYGPLSGDRMHRVATRDLKDVSLGPEEIASKVEDYGPKPLSDGLSADLLGNIYITDMEHSAVLTLGPDRRLKTLVKDPRLRWPDGLSFGSDGWLYVTASALHHVILKSSGHVRSHAPYQILRFKPGPRGIAGH